MQRPPNAQVMLSASQPSWERDEAGLWYAQISLRVCKWGSLRTGCHWPSPAVTWGEVARGRSRWALTSQTLGFVADDRKQFHSTGKALLKFLEAVPVQGPLVPASHTPQLHSTLRASPALFSQPKLPGTLLIWALTLAPAHKLLAALCSCLNEWQPLAVWELGPWFCWRGSV